MMIKTKCVIFTLVLLTVQIGVASVLLTNGGFEQDLRNGWLYRVISPTYDDSLGRDTKYDADPDYELYMKKHHATLAKLYQAVNIPTTDLEFSVKAVLSAYEYPLSFDFDLLLVRRRRNLDVS